MSGDDGTNRALAALESMADDWACEIDLERIAENITASAHSRDKVMALMKQAFIEGAYRCYSDAREGKIPWLRVIS